MARNTVVPYNTGKIKIGCMYMPPMKRATMSVDAELLQRALLSRDRPSRLKSWLTLWWFR